jgi:hypothetical protein
MRIRIIGTVATTALLLSSCGGDGGSSGGGDRGKLVDQAVSDAKRDGVELDRDCVSKIVDRLSDDDVAKVANDEDPSEAGGAALIGVLGCGGQGAFVDQIIEQVGSTEGLDEECFRTALEDLDPAKLAADSNAVEMQQAILKCMSVGG